jgi:hypothetical protein
MSGRTLAQGLMAADGEQLRLIYVLMMETGIFHMIANKTKDFLEKNVDYSFCCCGKSGETMENENRSYQIIRKSLIFSFAVHMRDCSPKSLQ